MHFRERDRGGGRGMSAKMEPVLYYYYSHYWNFTASGMMVQNSIGFWYRDANADRLDPERGNN